LILASTPRDEYLHRVDKPFVPLVELLEKAVTAAAPELQARLSYGMLTFVIGKDFQNWVVAIGTTKKAVCLRFLFGAYFEDSGALLRPGSSTLSTIDFADISAFDEQLVQRYVREAVDGHERFKALAVQREKAD